jgi:hypothetical protein
MRYRVTVSMPNGGFFRSTVSRRINRVSVRTLLIGS